MYHLEVAAAATVAPAEPRWPFTVTIAVPAFNEAHGIRAVLQQI